MFVEKCVLVFIACLVICDSAIIDLAQKCSKDDLPCQTKATQFIWEKLLEGAGSDIGIPPLDPYNVTNLLLDVPDLLSATLVEGVVKGLKTCAITDFKPNFELGKTTLSTKCDRLVVKGHYMLSSSAPLLKSLLGGEDVYGNGSVKIKLENVKITVLTHFDLVEKSNEIYVKDKSFEILALNIDNANFKIDNIYLGKVESSKEITQLLNDSWKTALQATGKTFGYTILNAGFKVLRKIIENLPVSSYIVEDLKEYVQ